MQSIVVAERSKVQGIVVNFVDTTMQRSVLLDCFDRPKFLEVHNQMERQFSKSSFRKFRSRSGGCPFFRATWHSSGDRRCLQNALFVSQIIENTFYRLFTLTTKETL